MLAAAELFRAPEPYLDCLKCGVVSGVSKVTANRPMKTRREREKKTLTDVARLNIIAHYRWKKVLVFI